MKKYFVIYWVLISSLLFSTSALAQESAKALLQQMSVAVQKYNYEFFFIFQRVQGTEFIRYRHAVFADKSYAHFLNLDGPRREIIQHGEAISYYETDLEPFTFNGDHIVDALPNIVFADIEKISRYYNFLPVGRMRIADRPCDVIRVISRDGLRYSYDVWLDVETKLPLRIDLLDINGTPLERYHVVSFNFGEEVQQQMKALTDYNYPPMIVLPSDKKAQFTWRVGWVPNGFKEIATTDRELAKVNQTLESRIYSDGLYSFMVHVSPAKSIANGQFVYQGRHTVRMETRSNQEIMVVGELPLSTIKRITENVHLGKTP